MRTSTAILLILAVTFNAVSALKGSTSPSQRKLRNLQAKEEKAPKEEGEGEGLAGPKEAKEDKESKDPKEKEVKADDKAEKEPKEKKEKKCKKAPKHKDETPPAASPNDAPDASPIVDDEPEEEEQLYCLQGDATADECQNAKSGKMPKGHQSISGNVEISVSYQPGSSATNVLDQVERVIRSETAAEFIGCDKKGAAGTPEQRERRYQNRQRQLQEEGGGTATSEEPPPATTDDSTAATDEVEDELRVTGVDFQKVEIAQEDCQSSDPERECDVITSNVEIYYDGQQNGNADLTDEEQEEMFALLASTIESQAASGAFDNVGGTVESVEIVNTGTGSGSTGSGSGGNNDNDRGGALTRGIPSGLGGLVAIVIAGFVIYKLLGRDNDNDRDENGIDTRASNNVAPVEAEAIVLDESPDKKDEGTWAKMKNQFL